MSLLACWRERIWQEREEKPRIVSAYRRRVCTDGDVRVATMPGTGDPTRELVSDTAMVTAYPRDNNGMAVGIDATLHAEIAARRIAYASDGF